MNVAYLVSEMAPFAKTGGLADVAGALPSALARLGIDARIFTPLHRTAGAPDVDLTHVSDATRGVVFSMGGQKFRFDLLTPVSKPVRGKSRRPEAPIYFIDCPELFDRPSIYTQDDDEPLRFLFFTRATLEASQRMGLAPDIVHCNDWQTALFPLLVKTLYAWDRLFKETKTLLTIHNLGYQGVFDSAWYDYLELDGGGLIDEGDRSAGRINFLKTGIRHADRVSTVSPTYAREIQTPEHGMGCDSLLRERASALTGIVNGVDYEVWSPQNDSLIEYRYSAKSLWRKKKNTQGLAQEVGLSLEPGVPLIGMVSRLTYQKGLELVFEVLPELIQNGSVRLAVLGSGEAKYERWFQELSVRFADRVFFYRGHHETLAHRIEASCDAFLMPSRYEPCGLNQLFSLKYGTVPIVHRTGGLADTVSLYDPRTGDGNGIVFDHFTVDGLRWALETATALFRDPETWTRIQRNGMSADYSWDRQAEHYHALYREMMAHTNPE